jgi:glycosyltransferase involved in cell wall biosynthesis
MGARMKDWRYVSARPATILQLVPELETGGAELSAIEIAAAVTAAGGRALVVSQGGRLEGDLAAAGGELIRLPVASKNPGTMLANAGQIAALARQEGAAIIHARSRAPAWSGLIAAGRAGVPFMTTYHGAYDEKGALKRFYNSVMVRGRLVIANSHYTARLIRERYATPESKIRVVHRGVGTGFDPACVSDDDIAAIRARWGVPAGARIILLAGRLTAWKGQRVLIEAFAEIRNRPAAADSVVVLAGDHQGREAYRDGLVAQAAEVGLSDRVLMVGHERDMPAAFAAAHVAVVASTDPEAFGRTAVEAQAMGVPVIATRHGAPPETVRSPPESEPETQTGWLVAPGDAHDLARRLEAALSLAPDARRAMGARARAHVQANFVSDVMKMKTLMIYDELLLEEAREGLLLPFLRAHDSDR